MYGLCNISDNKFRFLLQSPNSVSHGEAVKGFRHGQIVFVISRSINEAFGNAEALSHPAHALCLVRSGRRNAHRAAEQTTDIPEYPHTQKERLREEKAAKTTPADNTLQRMVDREAKRAEGKGVGYDRWAAKHNLKQMAATVTAYQQYGFSSPEELDEACSAAYAAMQESLTELKQVEKTLNGKKELQRQVLAYSKTRPVRDGLKQQKNAKAKAAYRQKHESDFIIADAAARYFRENGISKLPSYKALQAEIESLIKEKNSGYNDYRAKREEYRRLQTVKGNIDQILRRERKPVKRQEQER